MCLHAPAGRLRNIPMSVYHIACGDVNGIRGVGECEVVKAGIRVGIVARSKVDRRCSCFRGSDGVGHSDDLPFFIFFLVDFANFETISERVVEIKTGDGFGIGIGVVFGVVSVVRHVCKLVDVVVCFLFLLSLYVI
jgi:hypothetical protein